MMADIARSGLDSYEFARRLLVERGIAVAPGGTFGDEARAAVRLSLASPPETIAEGIRRIGEAIRENGTDRAPRTDEIMTGMDRSSVDWHGYIPAMVSPFTRDGDLDREGFPELRRVARR